MGTDFTYEDLEIEKIKDYSYQCTEEKECGKKKKCYIVKAIAKNKKLKKNTGYSHRLLWIQKDNFITKKIKFFDKRSKYLKTQMNEGFKEFTKNKWRPSKMTMTRGKKHKTIIETTKRDVKTKIKDSIFKERFLLSGRHVK